MISSSAGRNRFFWRSSRGFATASPNADDPPPNRTNRAKREPQIARNPALLRSNQRNLERGGKRVILSGSEMKSHCVAMIVMLRVVPPNAETPGPTELMISLLPVIAKVPSSL